MVQLAYSLDIPVAMAGMLADCGFTDKRSYSAEEEIPVGVGVVRGASDTTCRLPNRNQATLTYSADFVASNVINVTVNGVAISPVTFATDHATTFAAVVAAINGLAGIDAVAGAGRSIIITSTDPATGDVTVSTVVTLGVSQATGTAANASEDLFLGVAVHTHTLGANADGETVYAATETVGVLHRGRIWVPVEENVAMGDPVYLRTITVSADLRGAFRMSADSGNAMLIPNARWVVAGTDGGLAQLELNLP